VLLLCIISETYFEDYAKDNPEVWAEGRRRLNQKIEKIQKLYDDWDSRAFNPFCIMEFGLRRCFSEAWQGEVIERLALRLPREFFVGTSNVHYAKQFNLRPQGTMAHEYISAHAALYPLHIAQRQALYNWNTVFKGNLGTALTDTFTFDQFLRDFDLGLANLFTGCRHDSGDPYKWGHKMLDHYEGLKIDPQTKIAVWSDNLNIDKSIDIWKIFAGRIKTSFGIGTNLTNDLGPKALSQVIKLVEVNHMPVIKISDEPEKVTCDDKKFEEYAMHLFLNLIPNKEKHL
jgi:nicotinate phosphoribosyltransferase